MPEGFVDIHCHFLPGIDDGAADWQVALEMAQMAVADGTKTIIATPHQLGNFSHNQGETIRQLAGEFQQRLDQQEILLEVLPGGDVRIQDDMVHRLASGEVLTLADRDRHVLLELPHELYFPLESLLATLKQQHLTGILSHPERNQGILSQPGVLPGLVEAGCLMQVTAGSLMGSFGGAAKRLAEGMVRQGLVHFIATDAHGTRSRRPLMRRAYQRVAELADQATAQDLCAKNPRLVARGERVPSGCRAVRRQGWRRFFSTKHVA